MEVVEETELCGHWQSGRRGPRTAEEPGRTPDLAPEAPHHPGSLSSHTYPQLYGYKGPRKKRKKIVKSLYYPQSHLLLM